MSTESDIAKQYSDEIKLYTAKFTPVIVRISQEKKEKIVAHVTKWAEAKIKESGYENDRKSLITRGVTGLVAEVALEQLLGVEFVNWEIGNSTRFNHADLLPIGIKIGIKSVRHGNFPLISKREYTPQIIVIRGEKDKVAILGVASQSVLSKFQDINLVRDQNVVSKGLKTCFRGFSHLYPFKSLEELKAIEYNLSLESFYDPKEPPGPEESTFI